MDAYVLSVLAGTTRPLTGARVHRIAGYGSPNAVRAVLGRLVEQGLVVAEPAGRATLYSANRDHLAWPAVEALTSIRARLIERIMELIDGWSATPLSAALFGSAARGDGGVDSDIDVLLVRAVDVDEGAWEAGVDELRESVARWTGNDCQVYELNEAELQEHVVAEEPVVAEWRRDAVHLAGTPIGRLVTGVRGAR